MIIGPIKSHYALSTYLKPKLKLNFDNPALLCALKWPISIPRWKVANIASEGRSDPANGCFFEEMRSLD